MKKNFLLIFLLSSFLFSSKAERTYPDTIFKDETQAKIKMVATFLDGGCGEDGCFYVFKTEKGDTLHPTSICKSPLIYYSSAMNESMFEAVDPKCLNKKYWVTFWIEYAYTEDGEDYPEENSVIEIELFTN